MKSSQDYYEEAKDEVIALFRKHSGNEFNLINAITNVIAKCDRKIDELEREVSDFKSEVGYLNDRIRDASDERRFYD